jgi:hypothetical protein
VFRKRDPDMPKPVLLLTHSIFHNVIASPEGMAICVLLQLLLGLDIEVERLRPPEPGQ